MCGETSWILISITGHNNIWPTLLAYSVFSCHLSCAPIIKRTYSSKLYGKPSQTLLSSVTSKQLYVNAILKAGHVIVSWFHIFFSSWFRLQTASAWELRGAQCTAREQKAHSWSYLLIKTVSFSCHVMTGGLVPLINTNINTARPRPTSSYLSCNRTHCTKWQLDLPIIKDPRDSLDLNKWKYIVASWLQRLFAWHQSLVSWPNGFRHNGKKFVEWF